MIRYSTHRSRRVSPSRRHPHAVDAPWIGNEIAPANTRTRAWFYHSSLSRSHRASYLPRPPVYPDDEDDPPPCGDIPIVPGGTFRAPLFRLDIARSFSTALSTWPSRASRTERTTTGSCSGNIVSRVWTDSSNEAELMATARRGSVASRRVGARVGVYGARSFRLENQTPTA